MLEDYMSSSGRFEPVWTLEIQTRPEDADRILDDVAKVHPLSYGRYDRNASISAPGRETATPQAHSTTAAHNPRYQAGTPQVYPMVELKFSIERDPAILGLVMEAVLHAHHYEEPVIFLREDWVSRANYDPQSDNPNRWWNDGRGLPDRL
ncbi:MAG: hypothetical protein AAGA28_14925 [Pseudomonadota bacterium]